jgi:hypothetical protein
MRTVNSLHDIITGYLPYPINQQLTDVIMHDCANFLVTKNIDPTTIKNNFSVEFTVSADQSFIEIKGTNLISTLWLIDVFPETPENYILKNVCDFKGKKYIYEPKSKSLKIRAYGEKSRN